MIRVEDHKVVYLDKDGDFCRIELTRGKYAKVDPEDYDWLSEFKWFARVRKEDGQYDAVRNERGGRNTHRKKIFMARVILGLVDGVLADHKNHNTLDNRRGNLRVATPAQNQHNQRVTGRGRSKYKGVSWHRGAGRWQAMLCYNYKRAYLGLFDKEVVDGVDVGEIAAAEAYDKAAIKYFGAYACLNFPD